MNRMKSLWELFIVFSRIGGFTFGGGIAMLPLIQHEVTEKRKWVSEEEILDIFAISQSIPGVISINSAIFIGNKVQGKAGALAAAMGVTLPAFVSIILIVSILAGIRDNIYVEKFFLGIKAASAALILLAALKLGRNAVKGKMGYMIAAVAFVLIVIFNIHAMWAVVFGSVAGCLSYFFKGRGENV